MCGHILNWMMWKILNNLAWPWYCCFTLRLCPYSWFTLLFYCVITVCLVFTFYIYICSIDGDWICDPPFNGTGLLKLNSNTVHGSFYGKRCLSVREVQQWETLTTPGFLHIDYVWEGRASVTVFFLVKKTLGKKRMAMGYLRLMTWREDF